MQMGSACLRTNSQCRNSSIINVSREKEESNKEWGLQAKKTLSLLYDYDFSDVSVGKCGITTTLYAVTQEGIGW